MPEYDPLPRPKITIKGNTVQVRTPYRDPLWTHEAHMLGGDWDGTRWVFDLDMEHRVRTACVRGFGSDGDDTSCLVTVTLPLETIAYHDAALLLPTTRPNSPAEIRWCGRIVATREKPHDPVVLGRGVRLVAGAFDQISSSTARPELGRLAGIVVEMTGVPQARLRELSEEERIVITRAGKRGNRDALLAEQARLLTRLAEISRELDAIPEPRDEDQRADQPR